MLGVPSTLNSQMKSSARKWMTPPKPCIFGPACGSSLPTATRSSRQVESSTTGSSQASTGNAARGAHATRLGASLLQLPKPRQRDRMTSAGMTLVPGDKIPTREILGVCRICFQTSGCLCRFWDVLRLSRNSGSPHRRGGHNVIILPMVLYSFYVPRTKSCSFGCSFSSSNPNVCILHPIPILNVAHLKCGLTLCGFLY